MCKCSIWDSLYRVGWTDDSRSHMFKKSQGYVTSFA